MKKTVIGKDVGFHNLAQLEQTLKFLTDEIETSIDILEGVIKNPQYIKNPQVRENLEAMKKDFEKIKKTVDSHRKDITGYINAGTHTIYPK